MHDAEVRLREALGRPARPSSDFDLNPAIALPPGRVLRPAGVLVAVWLTDGGAQYVLDPKTVGFEAEKTPDA